jgi:uncharacterized protein YbjT (DUF2867 family)
VTGAAGLTGSCVTRLLLDHGHEVTAVVRNVSGPAVDPRAQLAVVDCQDVEAMKTIARSTDALVHVAGIHLAGSVAAACDASTPPRLVVVSTANAVLPGHPNAERYRRYEEELRRPRPDTTLVRPTMIYGSNRDRNVHKVVRFANRWRFLPVPTLITGSIQPIHYADLATGIVTLVTAESGLTVSAAGPIPLTLETAARTIFAALGLKPRLVRFPLSPLLPVARAWYRLTGSKIAARLTRLPIDRTVDVGHISAVTGMTPRSFDVGVSSLVEEMRALGTL